MKYTGFFIYVFSIFSIFSIHLLYAKYQSAVLKISRTAVIYHRNMINNINNNHIIIIAKNRNIFDVIAHIASITNIGKLRKIKKLNITLRFRKNIRKYSLIVVFKFKTDIFIDDHIAGNVFLFHKTISYLLYANSIFNIIDKNNIIKKI